MVGQPIAFDMKRSPERVRSVRASRRAEGETRAREFFERGKFRIVPFDEAQAEIAKRGFQIYGKGRHRAGLNLGDCFSYALAKSLSEPLLFKGNDFRLTDVIPAL